MTTHSTKIAALLGSLNGAGAEKTILTLCTELAKKDISVTLYTLHDNADYAKPNEINHVSLGGKSVTENKQRLAEQTQQNTFDLFITSRAEFYDHIHTMNKICSVHITPTAWINAHKWQFLKRFKKTKQLEKKFQNKRLVALSEGIKADLIRLKCNSEDITVIPNPFDIDFIRAQASAQGELPQQPYAIYIASFIKRKRHKDLINAFSKMKNKQLSLVLVGKGEEEANIKRLASKLGISNRIIFWGWDENPYRLIKNASISYLTSKAEGLPRGLIESLIIGVPVVSTDCPSGPNELLMGPHRDFLVPVGDVNAIARASDQALAHFPTYEFDEQKFNAENIANRYLESFVLKK